MIATFNPASLLALDSRFQGGKAILTHPKASGEPARVQITVADTSTTLYTVTSGRTVWLLGVYVYSAATATAAVLVRICNGRGDNPC